MNESAINEKRWVATLMVDVVGSTELTNRVGPEDTFQIMQDLLREIVDTITQSDGYPVDFAGDSVFAIFGAPKAVENAALVACTTAFDIIGKLARRTEAFVARHGIAPQLRIGIAGGEVLIAGLGVSEQIKLSALGPAVNLAARLQAQASPGEIYCSEEVFHEVDGFAEAEAAGTFALKGFDGDVHAYRLVDVNRDTSTLEARKRRSKHQFVGRDTAVTALRTWLGDPGSTTRAQLVFGPAGIGKSRFVQKAIEDAGLADQTVVANCSIASKDEPFSGMVKLINGYLFGSETDISNRSWDGLDALAGNDRPLSVKTLSLLQQRQHSTTANEAVEMREDLAFLFRAIATRTGRKIVIEDTHWLDLQSAEILEEFLSSTPDHDKIIFVSRFANDFDWYGRVFPQPVELEPLKQDDIAAMVAQLFPDIKDPEDLVKSVFERSEGNPLFAEEILRHVARKLGEDGFAQDGLVPSVRNIGSLQNLIFARFDLLPADMKDALKLASLIDRVITPAHLTALTEDATLTASVLSEATEQGLLEYNQDADRYRFAHALIRDAIAGSLSRDQKKDLHGQAADIIRNTSAEGADVDASLAFHYAQAGRIAEALGYQLAAAKSALAVYALPTCDAMMERYAEMLDSLGDEADDRALSEGLLVWCRCLDIYGNFKKLISVMETYGDRLSRTDDIFARAICYALMGKAKCIGGQIEASLGIIEEAEALATGAGEDLAAAHIKAIKLWTLIDHPQDYHDQIETIIAEVDAVAKERDDEHLLQVVLHMDALRYRVSGRMKEMDAVIEELRALGRRKNLRWAFTYSKWTEAISHHIKRDLPMAEKASRECLAAAMPGTVDYQAAQFFLNAAKALSGDQSVTAQEFEEQHQKCLAFGDHVFATPVGQQAAGTLLRNGLIREGWRRLEQAGAFAEAAKHKASIYRQKLATAEFLLTLAGLLPSPLARPKMHPLDIAMAVRLRIGAVKRAESLYDAYFAFRQREAGFYDAEAHIGRAVIAKSRKQMDVAATHFNAARAIYEDQEHTPGLERIAELESR